MVSKNVKLEEAHGSREIFGIKKTSSLGVYLGMPSHNSRKKPLMFEKIRTKIENMQ